uniref:Claudin n=1 Tax=Oncorhynchus kisutch TaxID=8019 RepID=A0A8C7K0D0_ONCKI
MASFALELVGVSLSVLGWILSIVSCALPMWRVSAFIGANIVTAQVYWEGLWMSCVVQSTGQMQCKVYDSMLALPQDLQAARALSVATIILGVLALLVATIGAKCTNSHVIILEFYNPIIPSAQKMEIGDLQAARAMTIIAIILGILGVMVSIVGANTIIQDFYNPLLINAQKRELGASLYIGWGAAALLLIGGAMLCSSCPPREEKRYKPPGMAAPHSGGAAGYVRKDYV